MVKGKTKVDWTKLGILFFMLIVIVFFALYACGVFGKRYTGNDTDEEEELKQQTISYYRGGSGGSGDCGCGC